MVKYSPLLRYGSLGLLIAQDTALVLLLRYSRSRTDREPYISSCAVATMECVKLIICFGVLLWSCHFDLNSFKKTLRREVLRPREVAKLSLPAFLYLIQNNLLYFALSNLRATPYKVVYNLKILTGAIFATTLLNQRLGLRRWLALVALFIGVVIVQTVPHEHSSSKVTQNITTSHQTLGFCAVFAAAITSGFCGVYQQKILQGSGDSMWARNIQMGVPSVFIGLISVFIKDGQLVWIHGPFHNFDYIVFGVIALQAIGGLNVAVILKYADNILKGFAAAFSTLASCLLEMILFSFQPSTSFLLGAGLINLAAFFYNSRSISPPVAAKIAVVQDKIKPSANAYTYDSDNKEEHKNSHNISPHLTGSNQTSYFAPYGNKHLGGATTLKV
mmetsp:Transcript_17941/g.23374  ORF Transcript_17941/g.23374 Transcript_17941/m.23374 type:complete len:388 (-) Transcript_17941:17-1180(-)